MPRYALLAVLIPGAIVEYVVVGDPLGWSGASVLLGAAQPCEVGWIFDGTDFVPLPPTLEQAKNTKLAMIDENSIALFAGGFEYAALVFSLSEEAQGNLSRMLQFSASLPYPFSVSTLDDQSSIAMTNPTDVQNFVDAGATRVGYILIVGGQIKDDVRAATTVAQVDAIQDTRS